jgi:hypothetical protein
MLPPLPEWFLKQREETLRECDSAVLYWRKLAADLEGDTTTKAEFEGRAWGIEKCLEKLNQPTNSSRGLSSL